MRETIILIEDEKLMRVTLDDALKSAGYEVISFETGTEALSFLRDNSFDVLVTDVRLPDIDGIDILRQITRTNEAQIIVMTAFGTIKDAVEAMRLGAFDYITKPFSLDEFLLLIERALDVRRLKDENIRLKKDLNRCYCFPNIIGESQEMKRVFSLVEKVAESDSTVLILGESGTGKELIATTIHYQSTRKDKPLIKINCAALPEGLIESELFGHEKGAFTGAIKRKPGRFELANGGTIFLDEIGDIPLSTQAKILRVIQERQFERVGGTETLNVDVRIIAATNKNLEGEVRKGNFREDLYYRLNVIPITLPPLRERKEDIPYLIDFFLSKCANKFSRNISFSKDAIDALLAYDYPGNIRELENIVERCVTLSTSDTIQKDDLPPFIVKKTDNKYFSLSDIAAEAEKEHIIRMLKTTKGNKTRAAEMLGISRKTLWEKMNAYRID
ncbi:MAG: sigma-54 dependent transcriptional regulator [Thermodesulfovibrionales bacterium]|jgi:two-component system response regulator AtoC|nr:sigma-54 dependent transcriptional regulator [Thermodesulfovibrionales bacterium]